MMTFGIRSSAIASPDAPIADRLSMARDAGFDVVELNFNHPQTGLLADDHNNADRIRDAADRAGLALTAHAPDTIAITLPNRDEVMTSVGTLKAIITGMQRHGARTVVVHPCGYHPSVPDGEAVQRAHCIEAARILADHCADHDMRLALEVLVPGRWSSWIDNLIGVVDEVASPHLGICLDTNHLNLTEDLTAAVRRAGRRIAEFHINDNHGEREEHLLPYDGSIDWASFAAAVREIDYVGPMVLEPGKATGSVDQMLTRATDAIDRLKAVLR